jgi:integrase
MVWRLLVSSVMVIPPEYTSGWKIPNSSMISTTYDKQLVAGEEPSIADEIGDVERETSPEEVSKALTAVSPTSTAVLPAAVPREQVEEEVRETVRLAEAHYRDNTRRNYACSWSNFARWAAARGLDPTAATPEIVATWLQTRFTSGANPRSLDRYYSAVAARLRDLQPDGDKIWARKRRPEIIYRVLRGARNERPTPLRQKKPLTLADYQYLADPLRFKRKLEAGGNWGVLAAERAILLFGLASGMRRSELVGLRLSDLRFEERGAAVCIRQSKTDQESVGEFIAVLRWPDTLRCPVAALERLHKHVFDLARVHGAPNPDAEPDAWYVFLPMKPSPKGSTLAVRPRAHLEPSTAAAIVREAATELGKKASQFGGHSLRAGFVTIAADQGASLEEIMNTTRHRSFEQVRGYIRRENPFERNASRVFFEPRKKETK